MSNRWSGAGVAGIGGSVAIAGVAALMLTMAAPAPATAQEPVDCGGVDLKLAEVFANPICYSSRFRNGGAMGRHESIHGESPDYMISFQSAESGAGHTYLHAIDFGKLMDFYGIGDDVKVLSEEREITDGFSYVSVGGAGLDSCILFLKQVRPIRSGYRAQYFGIACDKDQVGEYAPAEATKLLSFIEDY